MLKIILLEFVVVVVAAIFFGPLLVDTALRRRRLSTAPVAASDLEICARLLAFLESSFRGSTIGGLKIDDLTASLRRILAACRKQ